MQNSIEAPLIGDDVRFDDASHHYFDTDGETPLLSPTTALRDVGLIDYSGVSREVLEKAAERGCEVHRLCAAVDRGHSLDGEDDGDYFLYLEAYMLFRRVMRFKPDPNWIEKPLVVSLFGMRVGMTPDAFGTINGIPTLLERKTTSAIHPAWALQTAAYALGLRSVGVQVRQRMVVQLKPNGTYTLIVHDNPQDFDSIGDVFRVAALKRKYDLGRWEVRIREAAW